MNNHKKIRVGIITGPHFPLMGGMEFCNHFLAQSLNKINNTKAFVACNTMPSVPKDFSYPYKIYRSKSFSILTQKLKRKNIKKMIRMEKINVLHGTMLSGGGAEAILMGKKYNLPVVAHSQGADVQYVPEINYGVRYRSQIISKVRAVFNEADKIIAISNMNKKMVLDLGADEDKVAVIHNGVLYDEIGSIPFENMRTKFAIKPDDFLILTVGRNRPIKRMDLLYNALYLLKDKMSHIRCISIGPKENLKELIEKYGLERFVILTGRIPKDYPKYNTSPPYPELINFYRCADLFVSVSYVESFNNSALDSLACGTPILITKMQGIRDIINHDVTGYVLDRETPEDLANMLKEIIKKKRLTRERKAYIRESVAMLSWDNVAKKINDIYREVFSKHHLSCN